MVRIFKLVYFFAIYTLLISVNEMNAQEVEYTPALGKEYFQKGNYTEASKVYEYLLKKYPKEPGYNYYQGICQLKNREDISSAIKKLNYARIKYVSKDVYFYLGRAHQLTYQFNEAISNYKKFKQYASNNNELLKKTDIYIEECENGLKISPKIYQLTVLHKDVVSKKDILDMYYPAKDVGRLLKNGEFFDSGVDPHKIMFVTERGDVVYFSMATNSEDTLSIYKMEKLLDGWGDSEYLPAPVNSSYNEAYPFLETDGVTLYFSSDRPGGMGGFDIYKTFYDSESQSFLKPVNLGVPFNSPDDDFLFVSDEFNQVAWFASNRETSGYDVMVYTIKWNGKQVRNMADNVMQIQESAALRVYNKGENAGDSDDFTYDEKGNRTTQKGLFSFQINDTITYTQYDHFLSSEALRLFKDGFTMSQKKDSLAVLMGDKRNEYARSGSLDKSNKLVNEILLLEKQVYGLDDAIRDKYQNARRYELAEIKRLISAGKYSPSKQVKREVPAEINIDGVFIPEKYKYHTSTEFKERFERLKEIYNKVFSPEEIKELHYADSLYVWANILNMESSHLLEQSSKVEEDRKIKINQLLKKEDNMTDPEEELNSTQMLKESKELKILSTRIYHKALDKKFPIYWNKLEFILSNMNDSDSKQISELTYQGNAYFREAKRKLDILGGLSLEEYEKAGTLKRAGIESQEEALKLYVSMLNEGYQLADLKASKKEPVGVVQKSYAEIHRGDTTVERKQPTEEKVEKESQSVAKSEDVQKATSEYRVQIGVFRNPPNPNALANIPEVSKIELKDRGLTKYFAGHYNTKEEAESVIRNIVEAGFAGAFVVYFKDGVLAPLPE